MHFYEVFCRFLSVFWSGGLENSKFQDLVCLKIVLSPQRGCVLHCKHFAFWEAFFPQSAFGKDSLKKKSCKIIVLWPQQGGRFTPFVGGQSHVAGLRCLEHGGVVQKARP